MALFVTAKGELIMRRSLKPNLRTGRRLPPRLAKELMAATRELEKTGRKIQAIRKLMRHVPKQRRIGKHATRF
jgi:hypothetical protein